MLPVSDYYSTPIKLQFKREPDYNQLAVQTQILEIISKMNNQSIGLLDFRKHNYFYISKNHIFLRETDNKEVKKKGELFAEEIIYEKDKLHQINMKNEAFNFLSRFDVEKQKKIRIFSTHRISYKNKDICIVSNQYKPILFDDNGIAWIVLCISNIAPKHHKIETYIEFEDTNERFIFNNKNLQFEKAENIVLTLKEQGILHLASQGYTSKEIATEMGISINTVKFHKKKILKKCEAQNISEAGLYAFSHNLY